MIEDHTPVSAMRVRAVVEIVTEQAPTPTDDAILEAALADMEKARGPAARRQLLAQGLAHTSEVHRERLLIEAARLEVRVVLDKVDSLKSKAAKRRHLEECLATLRADPVDDELQAREIGLIEAALRELD
jgi:hypothetical protein